MNEELEALENIKKTYKTFVFNNDGKANENLCEKDFGLIKSTLERLENVETENTELKARNEKLEKYVYEKILKRLKRQYKYPEKIIEEIRFHDTYEEYAIEYVDDIKKDKKDIPLSETEFNLLKEMR